MLDAGLVYGGRVGWGGVLGIVVVVGGLDGRPGQAGGVGGDVVAGRGASGVARGSGGVERRPVEGARVVRCWVGRGLR